MKKKISIAIISLVCAVLITTMGIMGGCVNHMEDEVVIGDFVCQEWPDNTLNLKNLSEEGKKKKYIVVPDELDGRKVYMLGYKNAIFSSGRSNWESSNLEKIYINNENIFFKNTLFENCISLKKIILVKNDAARSKYIRLLHATTYFTSHIYYNSLGGDANLPMDLIDGSVANVSYYYNYEKSPNNGYYWIDDVEDGELIEFIPEEPTREGYKFEGWYKEEECINKWEFEKDSVVKAQIHLEGVNEFIENKLFAKWAKK